MGFWDNLRYAVNQGSTIQERLKSVDYDRLSEDEQETYRRWFEELESNTLTVSDIAEFVTSLKTTLAEEVSNLKSDDPRDAYIKARLANVIAIEKFISDKIAAQAEMYRMMAKESAPKVG